MASPLRLGLYADVANMYHNGGKRMQYDVLREFACRDGAEAVRLNAYVTYDAERARRDHGYRDGALNFHNKLRDYGFKVIVKEVRWFKDETGTRYGKANADLELAVDALLQSEGLDRLLIASGDGDFAQLIRALQNKGCRVEVVGLDNTGYALREEADLFMPGFLIPNLIPIDRRHPNARDWGELGSRVRGWCYWYEADRGFGYMRFLRNLSPDLWLTDARHPDSPWETAFFRGANLPQGVRAERLPSRNFVFEFELDESERSDGFQAIELDVVSRFSDPRLAAGRPERGSEERGPRRGD